ncbi:hypothetical protein DL96DRAFT_34097 [Flagelloscypha sp. PMI_526]|nr:hypothetical protein DL96DRAFT_34097 [Flagelloscypha sp. PMI_526]
MKEPWLPSVLPSLPALADLETTLEKFETAKSLGRVTNPDETPIHICGFTGCFRLFPSRDRVLAHRKRDHESSEEDSIITWNK